MKECGPDEQPYDDPTAGRCRYHGAAEQMTVVTRGWRLAALLRRSRLAAGKTIEEVAAVLECSAAKVSRMETGLVAVRIQDARELMDLFKVPDEIRDEVFALVRQARERPWWHEYADVLPAALASLMVLEDEAHRIQVHGVGLVPDLAQTKQYALAVGPGRGLAERRMQLVLARQHILTRPAGPARLHLVVDESALRRRIGEPGTMAGQYRHLITLSGSPHATVQVMPFAAGAHPAAQGSFSIISFTDPADPAYIYTGALDGRVHSSDAKQIARYVRAFDYACRTALDPGGSVAFLRRLAEADG